MAISIFCVIVTASSMGSFALGYYCKKKTGKRRRKSKKSRRSFMRSFYYGNDLKGSHYVAAVYENLIKYFEAKKPFLNPSLTVNEVAKAICTNKVYVSEAIKMGGKKNYNYLLNEYRIKHALELFQKDPGLRVNELAYKSGFNSPTCFTMAFKSIVNIPPGEWCRRYKITAGIDTGPLDPSEINRKLNRKNRSG